MWHFIISLKFCLQQYCSLFFFFVIDLCSFCCVNITIYIKGKKKVQFEDKKKKKKKEEEDKVAQ